MLPDGPTHSNDAALSGSPPAYLAYFGQGQSGRGAIWAPGGGYLLVRRIDGGDDPVGRLGFLDRVDERSQRVELVERKAVAAVGHAGDREQADIGVGLAVKIGIQPIVPADRVVDRKDRVRLGRDR